MLNKNQKIIFWGLFALIFVGLLLVATFLDLQISNLLASKYLVEGNYYSTNGFARFFEIIGEMPLYAFIMFACACIVVKCQQINRKWLRYLLQILFFVVAIGMGYYGGDKLLEYIYKLNVDTKPFLDNFICDVLVIFLCINIEVFVCFIIFYKGKNVLDKLVVFSVIILVAALVSNAIVQGIKPFWARERFRAIYYLEFRNVETEFAFTPWYVINGSSADAVATFDKKLNVTKTFFSSFPSGHTCAAGITYTLMFLPVLFEKLNNKKINWLFIVIPIIYTGVVALSRIVMGAHYLSDVLFGGSIVFLSSILGYVLVTLFLKKKQIKI